MHDLTAIEYTRLQLSRDLISLLYAKCFHFKEFNAIIGCTGVVGVFYFALFYVFIFFCFHFYYGTSFAYHFSCFLRNQNKMLPFSQIVYVCSLSLFLFTALSHTHTHARLHFTNPHTLVSKIHNFFMQGGRSCCQRISQGRH